MIVYISGPARTDGSTYDRFNSKEHELLERGWRVINPAKIDALSATGICWPISRALIDVCDAVYALDGWENCPEAAKEINHAVGLGQYVLFENKGVLDTLVYAKKRVDAMIKLPCCNTCGKSDACEHCPTLGDWTRINCYSYAPKETK